MTIQRSHPEVPLEQLRWRLDPASLPFETTAEVDPLDRIIGQPRGVESLLFGTGIDKPGFNIFVTGPAGTGRQSVVEKILDEVSKKESKPDDLCYVNNFKNPDAPVLIRLEAGRGRQFKKDVHDFVDSLKGEVQRLFESQEYIQRKKEIMESYEQKTREFFKELESRVKEAGLTLVNMQIGQVQRPEVLPVVDGEPTPMHKLEEMVEKGRFPKEEFEELKEKRESLKKEVDQIFLEIRSLQKDVQEKAKQTDQMMFDNLARDLLKPLFSKYESNEKVQTYLEDMVEDMSENLAIFFSQGDQQQQMQMQMMMGGDPFQPYKVNLLVDNADQEGQPVINESYPTYRNLFGSIERVVDRSGVWRTDYSRIRAGSFLRANNGYLILNLMDALIEPGVWPALKRALKSQKMEIQTYDPFYMFTSSGLKPEPIDINVKVIVLADAAVYYLLNAYDEDTGKIFKVRADFDTSMDKSDDNLEHFTRFVRKQIGEEDLRHFDRTAAARLLEESVRFAGRQEKMSTAFPKLADLIREADYWAGQEESETVTAKHMDKALGSRIFRANRIEEHFQEMIDRGSLMIDVDGEVAGQVNGLAVFNQGDHMFGKPTRITASTAMGRDGIINIERESDLSGSLHNKGVFILAGYLRNKFAQDKPLSLSASLAFEQSYGGVDGDSASSTEIYALLSSLSGLPLDQSVAVTGSVNQKGEVQAIGGVNAKIEGFYHCCRAVGLTGRQGVLIPKANVKDLMLRQDVIEAIEKKDFHVWAVETIDEGIEILTGKKAGERKADGSYPKDSVNGLVDAKLRELAKGLKKFAAAAKKEEGQDEAG